AGVLLEVLGLVLPVLAGSEVAPRRARDVGLGALPTLLATLVVGISAEAPGRQRNGPLGEQLAQRRARCVAPRALRRGTSGQVLQERALDVAAGVAVAVERAGEDAALPDARVEREQVRLHLGDVVRLPERKDGIDLVLQRRPRHHAAAIEVERL